MTSINKTSHRHPAAHVHLAQGAGCSPGKSKWDNWDTITRPKAWMANSYIHPPKWVFPKIGGKPLKWMAKIMENPIKMDGFGGPTPIFGNIQMNQSPKKGPFQKERIVFLFHHFQGHAISFGSSVVSSQNQLLSVQLYNLENLFLESKRSFG